MFNLNIENFDEPEIIPVNIWKSIFDKQREIANKYKDIENMGTLLDEKDNVNTAFGQKWIKDFSWRVTEEIAEALEAKNIQHSLHYQEEMIDALHFLTELTIIAGFDEKLFLDPAIKEVQIVGKTEWEIVYYLGLMCNCLKNKPWKQTQMLTDKEKFKTNLILVWKFYIAIMDRENLYEKDIYCLYHKKNNVNQFRIRSKY